MEMNKMTENMQIQNENIKEVEICVLCANLGSHQQ